jgi:hypothetical protein
MRYRTRVCSPGISVFLVIVAAVSLLGGRATRMQAALAPLFSYPNFAATDGLTVVGDAAPAGTALRLTPGERYKRGAVWYNRPQPANIQWETTFQVRVAGVDDSPFVELPPPGADGLAFVLQNDRLDALGADKGGIGYEGIPRSLAIEFDVWPNNVAHCGPYTDCPRGDPEEYHIAIHSRGALPNSADVSAQLALAKNLPNLLDGAVHTVKITYDRPTLRVYVDDLTTPRLVKDLDLAATMGSGGGWIGITGSTGGSWATFDVLNWTYGNSATFTYLPLTARQQ